jgi:putative polyketide hydroxylase
MKSEHVPVLIVGGGPVGLTMSLLLAQQGIPALLVEKHAATAIGPRARGLNVRSMEIFRGLGIEGAIRRAGAQIGDDRYTLVVETLAGKEIRRSGGSVVADVTSNLSPTGFCLCAQNELEPCLVEAAEGTTSHLHFSTELVSFIEDDFGVQAEVIERATGIRKTLRAQYLVAADGAYSSIRDRLKIGTTGPGDIAHFINIYFRADLQPLMRDRPFVMCFVRNSSVRGALISVDNVERWTFNVSYDPRNESPQNFTSERCIKLVRQAIGVPDLEVELLDVDSWTAAARLANRFRAGRVFFVGDAAHHMPPAGAFGMNTGIQDAHNLAWKLAAVLRGQASSALLQTYEAERLPIARVTVAEATSRLESSQERLHGGRPQEGMPQAKDTMAMILAYRYVSDAILNAVVNATTDAVIPDSLQLEAAPGTRAPHVWLERQGKRISILDLFSTQFVLLVSELGSSWLEAAHALISQQKYELVAYSVGDEADLIDREHQWTSAYKMVPDGAILIRPDGFVAWRTDGKETDPRQTLERVLKHVLCR